MKIQFSSGLQTSANMHTNTPNTKRTQCYNMQLCVGDPIKKKKEVTAHIVRQADRQTGREREKEREIERDRDCVAMAHLWHRLLLTYAIKLSRNYTEICSTISQLAPNPSDDPAEMFAFVLLHY